MLAGIMTTAANAAPVSFDDVSGTHWAYEYVNRCAAEGYVPGMGDNKFESGYLNNGKPITEENVLELFAKAKTIWPDGTSWANNGDSNNHWYENTGLRTQVDGIILNGYSVDTSYACGGFAAMISDYLFGKYNNTMRRLDDVSKTRPG